MRNLIGLSAVLAIFVASPAHAEAADNAVAAEASATDIRKGENITDAEGKRIGKVYQVTRDGDPQVIVNMRLITVPAATLSRVDGKLVSSLGRKELN